MSAILQQYAEQKADDEQIELVEAIDFMFDNPEHVADDLNDSGIACTAEEVSDWCVNHKLIAGESETEH